MQRRTLLQFSASLCLNVPALASFAQPTITFKFYTSIASLSGVWLSMQKPWIDKVCKELQGRIKFEAPPNAIAQHRPRAD